ncbi:unnamed protein product [Schistosoma mattheei]|uniref:Uncharacterized protein n=1 Tax=Schistosoma mattheei TaxID=31246 RepID=A0A183PP58_9TREM|nr:unnamed protein product [Schistosoma mattheei]
MCTQRIGYSRHNIHLQTHTWVSPDHTTHNQIDHISISKKSTVGNVKSGRGSDIESDHHQLVVTKMELNLRKQWTTEEATLRKLSISFLRHTDKLIELKTTLQNRFQALQDPLKKEESTMEDNWKGVKEALTSTYLEVLYRKEHHDKK